MKQKQKETQDTTQTQSQQTNSQTQQHSTSSNASNALKQIQKLNYVGPDYSATFNPATNAYNINLNPDLASQKTIKMNQANNVLSLLSKYKPTNLQSTSTKDITQALDNTTYLDFEDLYNKTNNRTTADRERGSSFDAAKQANLQLGYSKQRAENVLKGLSGAQSLDTQNLSNNLNLYNNLMNNLNPAAVFNPSQFMSPYADVSTTGTSNSIADVLGSMTASGTSTGTSHSEGTSTKSGGLFSQLLSIGGLLGSAALGNPSL